MNQLPIYVIHYQAPKWLAATISSIQGSIGLEPVIVVINNGGEVDAGLPVRVVQPAQNTGYAGGANIGLAEFVHTDFEYCVVASHDAIVEPTTLISLLNFMELHPDIGIAGPVVEPSGLGALLREDSEFEDRDWISGTLLCIRKKAILEFGMFDARFGSYVEDVDLCRRAHVAGWRVGRLKTARTAQNGSGTGDALSRILTNHILLALKSRGEFGFVQQCLATLSPVLPLLPRLLPRKHRATYLNQIQTRLEAVRTATRRYQAFKPK